MPGKNRDSIISDSPEPFLACHKRDCNKKFFLPDIEWTLSGSHKQYV